MDLTGAVGDDFTIGAGGAVLGIGTGDTEATGGETGIGAGTCSVGTGAGGLTTASGEPCDSSEQPPMAKAATATPAHVGTTRLNTTHLDSRRTVSTAN